MSTDSPNSGVLGSSGANNINNNIKHGDRHLNGNRNNKNRNKNKDNVSGSNWTPVLPNLNEERTPDKGKLAPHDRYGRTNHPDEKCEAKKHIDGTLLHTLNKGNLETNDDETHDVHLDMSDFVSQNFAFYNDNDSNGLMFLQSNDQSVRKQTMSSNATGITGIPLSWILLDSQSTVDVFCNSALLTQICKSDSTLTIRCNAGVKETNLRGYLSGYGWVWYFPGGIANILSLSRVKDKFRVTYDSALNNTFHVHKDNGVILNFKEASKRLYYFDTAARDDEGTMLVTTVEGNASKFSAYDFAQAKKARDLQRRIGRPSIKDFIHYVSNISSQTALLQFKTSKMQSLFGGLKWAHSKAKQYDASLLRSAFLRTAFLRGSWTTTRTLPSPSIS